VAPVQTLPERFFGDETCTDSWRAASKSRIHSMITSDEGWNGGSALGTSSNAMAAHSPVLKSAVSDQAFLCRRVNFVEYMVSQREKDRLPFDTFRGLYNVGMMTHD